MGIGNSTVSVGPVNFDDQRKGDSWLGYLAGNISSYSYQKEFDTTLPFVTNYLRQNYEEIKKDLKSKDIDQVLFKLKEQCGYPSIGVRTYVNYLKYFQTAENKVMVLEIHNYLAPLLNCLNLTGERYLLYFVVDYSGSMSTSMQNGTKRIDNVSESIVEIIEKEEEKMKEIEKGVDICILGYGFSRPSTITTATALKQSLKSTETPEYILKSYENLQEKDVILHSKISSEDIIERIYGPVSMEVMKKQKAEVKRHISKYHEACGGRTPLLKSLKESFDHIQHLTKDGSYKEVVLFLLTDGEPTDGSSDDIISSCQFIKSTGVWILTCLLSNNDYVVPKTLFGKKRENWKEESNMLWECCSSVPPQRENLQYIESFLIHKEWILEENYKLFSQINHSEHLSEYINTSFLTALINK